MTNKEMRDVVKALNVELFKMNYKLYFVTNDC